MNYISRKKLDRRTLLRSAGAAVALPFLDAMIPALTPMAQAAETLRPKRFVGI